MKFLVVFVTLIAMVSAQNFLNNNMGYGNFRYGGFAGLRYGANGGYRGYNGYNNPGKWLIKLKCSTRSETINVDD